MTSSLSANIVRKTSGLLSQPSTRPMPVGIPSRLKIMLTDGVGLFEIKTDKNFVIGRHSSDSPVAIDLSLFNAQELGISRRHMSVELYGDRIMVRDLNSSNGSRLNNKILTPQYVYELQHGDEIRLGLLRMRVYFIYD